MKTIYLAGRIDAIDHNTRTGWRDKCKEHLKGFNIISPMDTKTIKQTAPDEVMFNVALKNVASADLVLADIRYMPAENTGTACELMHAYNRKIPIIGWMNDTQVPRRVFMNVMVSEVYYSLEEAIVAVQHHFD